MQHVLQLNQGLKLENPVGEKRLTQKNDRVIRAGGRKKRKRNSQLPMENGTHVLRRFAQN